ncbi:hypothetical protein ACE6H2_011995 [Prunus campanulata]
MQYGDLSHRKEFLFTYMGADLAKDSYTSIGDISSPSVSRAVNQRDTNLLYFQHKSARYRVKLEARKQLLDELLIGNMWTIASIREAFVWTPEELKPVDER